MLPRPWLDANGTPWMPSSDEPSLTKIRQPEMESWTFETTFSPACERHGRTRVRPQLTLAAQVRAPAMVRVAPQRGGSSPTVAAFVTGGYLFWLQTCAVRRG
eukprot:scaffold10960_cov66-Phaeocystis_antarctica.AAC.2